MTSLKEKAVKVKESAKEKLVGVEMEDKSTAQTRAEFMQHAVQDEESGEYYMGQTEFVNAIAPPKEDYVRISPRCA